MANFGWSLPPGCNELPGENEPEVQQLEEIWGLLEAAGVDETLIEQVYKLAEELLMMAPGECPACESRDIEQQIKDQKELDQSLGLRGF